VEGKQMNVREHLDEITKILCVASLAVESALTATRGRRPAEVVSCDRNETAEKSPRGVMDMVCEVGALSEKLRVDAETLAGLL
jgi:hypothetical protein